MSILEVVIPTVLFIALVILRAEGYNRILGKTKYSSDKCFLFKVEKCLIQLTRTRRFIPKTHIPHIFVKL